MSSSSTQEFLLQMILDQRTRTIEDSLDEDRKTIIDSIKDSTPINDSYGNQLLSVGTDDKTSQFTTYGMSNNTLNFPLWLALYNDSWVFKRAIDKPAQDEINAGITLHGEKDFNKIYKILESHYPDFIQLLQWGALFGGSIAVMMFDNLKDDEYKYAMDISKIKQAKTMRFYVVDRWYGVSPSTTTVTNMNNLDFGKPKYYDVTLADGHSIRFHHDYVLRYEHRNAPKLIKNGMLQGWGYAEGSHILNELMRDEKLKSSIQSLVDKSLIEVIKMSGMRGVFMGADTDNDNQLRKRLEMVNWGRNFNSLTFLDKDDDYSQNTFGGLSGLSDILQENMWQVAAALEMQGVLFGDLKNGFSSDQDALVRYAETIKTRCELLLRPVYQKFLTLLYKLYDVDSEVDFAFNSLTQKTEQKDYADSLKAIAELLSQMMNDGVIDAPKYAKAMQVYADKGVLDLGLDDEYINQLKEEEPNLKEDLNIEEV